MRGRGLRMSRTTFHRILTASALHSRVSCARSRHPGEMTAKNRDDEDDEGLGMRPLCRGEFFGAVLFCTVLPLIGLIGVTVDYLRHAR